MTCECQVCKDRQRWFNILANGSLDERKQVFNEMYERIEEAETDVQYYKAVHTGVWPDAEKILENRLQTIRNKNASNLSVS